MTADDQVARTRALFDDWARLGKGERMERSHSPAARLSFALLDLKPGQRYLDVGCGSGYTVRWAAAVDPSVEAVGLDVSPEMITLARRLAVDVPNAAFHLGVFPDDAPDGPFDAIFSMEVFYYLPDLDGALAAVHGLLRPGGRFVCVVDFYAENVESAPWPEQLDLPMNRLSMAGWKGAFEAAGFAAIQQDRLVVDGGLAAGSLMTTGRRRGL
ncbi:MAG: methyltransferase domain-containing protein [Alphaproteobacteria bacterium]|nr:methyltransferase domain-containing protein [Alphaproteobacteria bacterium]